MVSWKLEIFIIFIIYCIRLHCEQLNHPIHIETCQKWKKQSKEKTKHRSDETKLNCRSNFKYDQNYPRRQLCTIIKRSNWKASKFWIPFFSRLRGMITKRLSNERSHISFLPRLSTCLAQLSTKWERDRKLSTNLNCWSKIMGVWIKNSLKLKSLSNVNKTTLVGGLPLAFLKPGDYFETPLLKPLALI